MVEVLCNIAGLAIVVCFGLGCAAAGLAAFLALLDCLE